MIRIIIISFFFFLIRCEPIGPPQIKLVDQFQLNRDSPDAWNLICKLGCGVYPNLNDVRHVKWNKHIIIAKNLNSKGYKKVGQWYIFYSKEEELKCCKYTSVIGPVDSFATEKFIYDNGIGKYETLNLK